MTIQVFLSKAGRRWVRRFPSPKHDRIICHHYRKWCADEELLTWTNEGFLMYASPRDYVSFRIFFFGMYDLAMTEFIKAHVPEGGSAIDIGSERGWFSLLMGGLVGPEGRVDAFEASALTFKKLESNISLNKFSWIHPYNYAICNNIGIASFVPSDKVQVSAEFLKESGGHGHITKDDSPDTVSVKTITLDEHAERTAIGKLDFIKIDIEGAEVEALKGGRNTIRRFRPIIAVEYNQGTSRRAGTTIEELDDLLDSMEFDRYTYTGRLRRLRLDEWKSVNDDDIVFNVYCFPRTRRH